MARGTAKSPEAFRTISEAADVLDLPQHVLRFWETRFSQIKPMKRSGGRRYYRPGDIALLRGIRHLLYDEGYTIKGVQRILRERGVGHVAGFAERLAAPLDAPDADARQANDAEPVQPNGQMPAQSPARPEGDGSAPRANPLAHPTAAPMRADPVRDALSGHQPQLAAQPPSEQAPPVPVAPVPSPALEPAPSCPPVQREQSAAQQAKGDERAAPAPSVTSIPGGSGLRFVPDPPDAAFAPTPTEHAQETRLAAPPNSSWTPPVAQDQPRPNPLPGHAAASRPQPGAIQAAATAQHTSPPPLAAPTATALTDEQKSALADALRTLEACKAHLDQVRHGLAGSAARPVDVTPAVARAIPGAPKSDGQGPT